ncbi:hypothetical protein NEHOM01_1201 [Nematocida homosporus]|uniref:uncharacterized protein n=1 Tax=Nematocida homosporus TaxID=1912981 RepID=UPI00221E37B5|nr:uncharacterized protein NEHOM01_1201 [Nematocida homosporus]KAI5185978.1 hypothetical protein NEHOM01_1201 [Nematocida homosporus]
MLDILAKWRRGREEEVREQWRERGEMQVPRGCVQTEGEDWIMVEAEVGIKEGVGVLVSDLGAEVSAYFGFKRFNRVQSEVVGVVFQTNKNLLVCAPTGTGKTEIGILAIVREYREKGTGMRLVYLGPTKALLQEVAGKVQERLPGLVCLLDTSDQKVRDYQDFNVLFTTPEKFDLLTGKDRISYDVLVVDEIHLLGEKRGGILESGIIRAREKNSRIIGLGAAVPNYREIAEFIGADLKDAFCFGAAYREVKMVYRVVGMRSGKTAEKVLLSNLQGRSLVFVSAKEDTFGLASLLARDRVEVVQEKVWECLGLEFGLDTPELNQVKSLLLRAEYTSVFKGVGVHNSGIPKLVRTAIEKLFSAGVIDIICATGTLATGVNLPADTVIVYGTALYKEEVGWTEYTFGEIAQMCGRAGRKGITPKGTAVVITDEKNLILYAKAVLFQFPIESCLPATLPTRLLYEVATGRNTLEQLSAWLQKSFFFIRARNDPVFSAWTDKQNRLIQSLIDYLVDLRVICLAESGSHSMNNSYRLTQLGQTAFVFYVDPETLVKYAQLLNAFQQSGLITDLGDILLILSTAEEFQHLSILPKDQPVWQTLTAHLPYPIKTADHPTMALIRTIASPRPKVSYIFQLWVSSFSSSPPVLPASIFSSLSFLSFALPRLVHALQALALAQHHQALFPILDLAKTLTHQQWKYSYLAKSSLTGSSPTYTHNSPTSITIQLPQPSTSTLIAISTPTSPSLISATITSHSVFTLTIPATRPLLLRLESLSFFHHPIILPITH